ncbi:MAG TPA: TetR/AcrR family transcriptional regulator [Anaerolineae bacterium]|nr:TetR/AcrR family transcriptional regulator [Anaerolineae bacterium]
MSNNPNSKTRDRIMDAALNIFARKGFHDTRIDEIASEADTSKGSLYFHFANKERLFLALVDQFADLLERRVITAIEQEEPGMARVQVALTTCLDTFGQYRRPAKILLVQAVGLGSSFEKKRLQVNGRFAQLIATNLQEAVNIGHINPIDVEVVAHAWMGAIYEVIIRWVYTGEPEPARIIDALLPLLLKSVDYQPTENSNP